MFFGKIMFYLAKPGKQLFFRDEFSLTKQLWTKQLVYLTKSF